MRRGTVGGFINWGAVKSGDPCPVQGGLGVCRGIMRIVEFKGGYFLECDNVPAHCRVATKEEKAAAKAAVGQAT